MSACKIHRQNECFMELTDRRRESLSEIIDHTIRVIRVSFVRRPPVMLMFKNYRQNKRLIFRNGLSYYCGWSRKKIDRMRLPVVSVSETH